MAREVVTEGKLGGRGSNVSRAVSGPGVGLAGTRHIVEQPGGVISVESVLGKDSMFTVCLPVIREPAGFVDV
jgi:signal transduction histidine kinase